MEINKIVRYLTYSLELLVLFMLQQTPGLFPEIMSARPVLLYAAVINIAVFEKEIPAMGFGIYTGMLIDFGFGSGLGFHAIVLMPICLAVSVMTKTIMQVNLGTAILTGVWTVALLVLASWLYQYLLRGYDYPTYALLNHYLPKYIYTLILFPLTFVINRSIAKLLRSPE
jgi:rod shape-determining protein MreD.